MSLGHCILSVLFYLSRILLSLIFILIVLAICSLPKIFHRTIFLLSPASLFQTWPLNNQYHHYSKDCHVVVQSLSCVWLCKPENCSTPGFPVLHYLLEFAQTRSIVAQLVKNPPAMWETWVRPFGWEDPLEKGKVIHSNILAWRIPWTAGSQHTRSHPWWGGDLTSKLPRHSP